MISGGCVLGNSRVRKSILFSEVSVENCCELDGVLALAGCRIGPNSNLRNVILDNGCIIPANTIDVTEPTAISITLAVTPTDCDQPSGSITIVGNGGSVTAGNSSQTSDGAAFVMVMSEEMVKELNVKPIARLI